jgi:hypothetical protein
MIFQQVQNLGWDPHKDRQCFDANPDPGLDWHKNDAYPQHWFYASREGRFIVHVRKR